MKKAIYTLTLLSLLTLSFGVVGVSAQDVVDEETIVCAEGEILIDRHCHPPMQRVEVETGMTESTPGGEPPFLLAGWQMNKDTQGDDDKRWRSGAQFMPPGVWGEYKEIEICAIAADPDGRPGEGGEELVVYADVFYPEGRALGRCHEEDEGGCGLPHGYELELSHVLDKQAGYELFCRDIRRDNPNLPDLWNDYSWDDICNWDTGALMKEQALVYCKHKELSWEDPAGDYDVGYHAVDKAGAKSTWKWDVFQYLPLTAFEVDFSSVNYGAVKLNTIKYIDGDVTFDEQGNSKWPTVRNVGNTRLTMKVKQDDMGLGKTENGSEEWNVKYDARVGSRAARAIYEPYEWAHLDDILGLSCTDEMDFSIRISKFHSDTPDDGKPEWGGDMWLGAEFAPFAECKDRPSNES
jgi:hypothetical protein